MNKIINIEDMGKNVIVNGQKSVHILPIFIFNKLINGTMLISEIEDYDDIIPPLVIVYLEKDGIEIKTDHKVLYNFYEVDSDADLIKKQSEHIKRLQSRLPKIKDSSPIQYRY